MWIFEIETAERFWFWCDVQQPTHRSQDLDLLADARDHWFEEGRQSADVFDLRSVETEIPQLRACASRFWAALDVSCGQQADMLPGRECLGVLWTWAPSLWRICVFDAMNLVAYLESLRIAAHKPRTSYFKTKTQHLVGNVQTTPTYVFGLCQQSVARCWYW